MKLSRPSALALPLSGVRRVPFAQTARRRQSRTTTATSERGCAGPGQQDACAIDLNTTVVAADGSLTREAWKARSRTRRSTASTSTRRSRPIPTPNSDMTADPAERNVVRAAVRALRVAVPAVRAAVPAGHARRPAPRCWPAGATARSIAASRTTTCSTRGTTTCSTTTRAAASC